MDRPEDMWDPSARLLEELERDSRLASRLRERLDEALVTCPAGYAVAMAAFDWREAADVPVPLEQLRRQTVRRMAGLLPGRPMTDEEFDAGLAWAGGDPPLVGRTATGSYEIAEELRGPLLLMWRSANAPHEAPPEVTPLEAIAVGRAVMYSPDGDSELARRLWAQVAAGEDPDAAELAVWHLAEAAQEDGDLPVARRAYEQIMVDGYFATAPRAALALAELDFTEAPRRAAELLRRAVDGAREAGHRAVVARAARLLGALRARHGDEPGVVEACRLAFDHGDPLTMPADGLMLATLLRGTGDPDGAEGVLRRVIGLDNPIYTAKAVAELSGVLVERGDLTEARRILSGALDEECVFRAGLQIALAGVQFALEDLPAAERLLDDARSQPVPLEPEEWARAGMLAGQIAVVRGDDGAAAHLFTEVLYGGGDEAERAAHLLALACGEHLRLTGPCAIPGTEPLLRHLMATADSPLREWAAYGVGRIAHNAGDLTAAGEAYRAAAAGNDPRYGALAALRLADLPAGPDEQDEILRLYMRIIEREPGAGVAEAVIPAGRLAQRRERYDLVDRIRAEGLRHAGADGPHAAQVAFALGVLEADVLGCAHRAIPCWEIAADSDDPEISPVACFNLGVVRTRRLAPLSAARDLRRAVASGHPEFGPRALLALGRLAEEFFDFDAASEHYLAAHESDHPRVRLQAAFHLACLVRDEQPEDAEAALHQVIESTAPDALIGAAYAQLGRVYAEQGNRRMANRYWRRGKHHPVPAVARAYALERAAIGRVYGPRRPGPKNRSAG